MPNQTKVGSANMKWGGNVWSHLRCCWRETPGAQFIIITTILLKIGNAVHASSLNMWFLWWCYSVPGLSPRGNLWGLLPRSEQPTKWRYSNQGSGPTGRQGIRTYWRSFLRTQRRPYRIKPTINLLGGWIFFSWFPVISSKRKPLLQRTWRPWVLHSRLAPCRKSLQNPCSRKTIRGIPGLGWVRMFWSWS